MKGGLADQTPVLRHTLFVFKFRCRNFTEVAIQRKQSRKGGGTYRHSCPQKNLKKITITKHGLLIVLYVYILLPLLLS